MLNSRGQSISTHLNREQVRCVYSLGLARGGRGGVFTAVGLCFQYPSLCEMFVYIALSINHGRL